jgi:hypothetical protein
MKGQRVYIASRRNRDDSSSDGTRLGVFASEIGAMRCIVNDEKLARAQHAATFRVWLVSEEEVRP